MGFGLKASGVATYSLGGSSLEPQYKDTAFARVVQEKSVAGNQTGNKTPPVLLPAHSLNDLNDLRDLRDFRDFKDLIHLQRYFFSRKRATKRGFFVARLVAEGYVSPMIGHIGI